MFLESGASGSNLLDVIFHVLSVASQQIEQRHDASLGMRCSAGEGPFRQILYQLVFSPRSRRKFSMAWEILRLS